MPSAFLGSDGPLTFNRALRYSGATSAIIGVTIPGSTGFIYPGSASWGYAGAGNFAIDAGTGYQRLLVLGTSTGAKLRINRTTDGGATYSTVFTSTATVNAAFGSDPVTNVAWGPIGVYVGGVLVLFVGFYAQSGAFVTTRSFDGGDTWAAETSHNGVANPGFPCMYQGKLWLGRTDSRDSLFYDPAANTTTVLPEIPNGGVGAGLVAGAFNDRFVVVSGAGAGGVDRAIYEWTGSWSLLATLATGVGASSAPGHLGMFMPDGANLWCFWFNTNAGGWRASVSAGSNLSSWTNDNTPVPVALQSGQTRDTAWCPWVDAEATPGVYPTRYAFHTTPRSPSGAMTLYQWNGGAAPMTAIDSGGDRLDHLNIGMLSQGSNTQNVGERKIELVSTTPVLGGERWTFKLYSPLPSVDTANVRFWIGTAQEEFPITQAQISNASIGTIVANAITGLDAADNGVTNFQVTVNLQAMGYSPGQRRKLVAEVYS